jgi:hypothetical protein
MEGLMSWLDVDFPYDPPDPVNPHYVGIELVCVTAGLEYEASTPNFSIRVTREYTSRPFQVFFTGSIGKDKVPGTAKLTAGYDLDSVEACIIRVVNRLEKLRRRKVERTTKYDKQWPKRPGPDDPPRKINVYTVKAGRIYRLVTKDYSIGVWRKNLESNYRVTFWRHDGLSKSRESITIEVGDSSNSVETLVLQAISNPEILLKS